jgi:hypothetical protein
MQGQYEQLHLLTADELRPFHYVETDCGIARGISVEIRKCGGRLARGYSYCLDVENPRDATTLKATKKLRSWKDSTLCPIRLLMVISGPLVYLMDG